MHGMNSTFRRNHAMAHVHRVAVLAIDGVYPFELGIPGRVFGAAGGRYEILTCSVDGRLAGGTSLREHLHAVIGVSPIAYRRTFRGTPSLTH
jgi:hypothetical protein